MSEQILSYAPRVIHHLRKIHKVKTAERLQNVKDAAVRQNDYKMSGLLSNATFTDKVVYHSHIIVVYAFISGHLCVRIVTYFTCLARTKVGASQPLLRTHTTT
jgi:hypothetical protein